MVNGESWWGNGEFLLGNGESWLGWAVLGWGVFCPHQESQKKSIMCNRYGWVFCPHQESQKKSIMCNKFYMVGPWAGLGWAGWFSVLIRNPKRNP